MMNLINLVPGPIRCSSDAFPAPTFQWKFNGHIIQREPILTFR